MNTNTPLLPEARFKPLSAAKLDGMINHALTFQQLPKQAQVIAFRRSWAQQAAYTAGLAAMAASILMAFLVTPQYTGSFSTQAQQSGTDVAASDVSDLILMDSFGA